MCFTNIRLNEARSATQWPPFYSGKPEMVLQVVISLQWTLCWIRLQCSQHNGVQIPNLNYWNWTLIHWWRLPESPPYCRSESVQWLHPLIWEYQTTWPMYATSMNVCVCGAHVLYMTLFEWVCLLYIYMCCVYYVHPCRVSCISMTTTKGKLIHNTHNVICTCMNMSMNVENS